MMESAAPQRILVVEDDPDIAYMVRETLRDEGYDAESLVDGRALLATVNRLRPDLILLDVVMPFADVRHQLAQLRVLQETRHVPVILVTGDTDTACNLASDEPVVGVALKPFNLDDLLAKIAKAVGPAGH